MFSLMEVAQEKVEGARERTDPEEGPELEVEAEEMEAEAKEKPEADD